MKTILAFSLLCIIGVFPAFAGQTVDMTGPRVIRINGEINGSILGVASSVEQMSSKSKDPISLVINSPGGSVAAGLQLVEAIHIAQSRGVTVRCSVTTLAASMAFIVLAECNERYALANSLLLFHPARAMLMFAALRAEDAKYMGEELAAINAEACERLEASLGVASAKQKEWFDYHYRNETLWTASRLSSQVPRRNWITIVSDIKTDRPLFQSADGQSNEDASVRSFLQVRGGK